ncbi:MAG: cytidine deaminase [Bacilli bacterium]
MINKLKELLNNSYSPYSKFRVAAIIITNDNKEFNGVNIENISYNSAICAERSAIVNAISNGYLKEDIKELHLMCDSDKISTPCFVCRQVISELINSDKYIYCYNNKGQYTKYKVEELCPYPFNKEDLIK